VVDSGAAYGPDHPNVARDIDNLAFTVQTGHQPPHLPGAVNNYFRILVAAGRSEAEARAEIGGLPAQYGMVLVYSSPPSS